MGIVLTWVTPGSPMPEEENGRKVRAGVENQYKLVA